MMTQRLTLLAAFGLGAGTMYLLDPDRGRSRRAVVRDKMIHYGNRSAGAINVASRDLAHRTRGLLSEARSSIFPQRVSDEVLLGRVRARLGHVVSHPHAIEVQLSGGVATLMGPIYEDEVDELIDAIEEVHGIRSVTNQLEPHSRRERIPALQGGKRTFRKAPTPATRLVLGTLIGGLAAISMSDRARSTFYRRSA